MCSTWGALKGYERYFPSGHMKIWKIAKYTPCPSKGITLCQSLIGTQGEFLCNTNTCALHSKVILTHAMSWPKSYNANSTLLTMIHYTSAHVWRRKAYDAS